MATEDLTGAGKFIDDLVATNPVSSDLVSSGDEHLRGVKNVLKNSFGAVTGAVTATHTELNYTDGVTSAIQTQLNTVSTTANAALPKAGGTVSGNLIMQNNINLGDNNRLYVGNSNDLSIYHSGSHSVIAEAGTGNLLVQAIDLTLGSTTGETHATFVNNGASTLFFDNSSKVATSNTGITVTGTVAATAFSGDGSSLTNLPAGGVDGIVSSANATAMTITAAEKIGIGTTSPVASGVLNVDTASSTTNNLIHSLDVESHTTGTAANGVGTGIKFWGSMTGQNRVELGQIGFHNQDVSGANGDFVVLTRPNATSVERLRIDSSGRVTMPHQPVFRAIHNLGDVSSSGQAPATFGAEQMDQGSNYSTSTNRFTAPVTGKYAFHAGFSWYSGSDRRDIWLKLRINGSDKTVATAFIKPAQGNNTHTSITLSDAHSLSANDYVEIAWSAGSSIMTYAGGGRGYFSGYLIG